MKKILLILVTTFFLISNLAALASDPGPPKEKEWKGKGEKIEFQSMPILTIKDFLNGVVPEKRNTIWGTLNFPANAPDKNVPVVVLLHGMGGIHESAEFWLSAFNSIGLATFMVDSNWGRRNCNKIFKKTVKGLWCADVNQGMNRIIDGYRALELLSKHPRIDPARIGCLGISLGAKGCLYLNVKRFQKMWGTPGIEFAASVPLYPPCDVRFKEDDVISDTPIRIHVGELDTYFPVDSCVNYVELLRSKGKDVEVKVYPGAHHGFDADPTSLFRGKTKMVMKGYNAGRCYFEENTDLTEEQLGENFAQQITQVGFNEFLASATEKEKKKLFKYMKSGNKRGYNNPFVIFDESCVSNSTTIAYDKNAAKEATKLVKDFFISTFAL